MNNWTSLGELVEFAIANSRHFCSEEQDPSLITALAKPYRNTEPGCPCFNIFEHVVAEQYASSNGSSKSYDSIVSQ